MRGEQATIEIDADPKVFNRMTIWRTSEQAPFICIEPAYDKNALNDEPIFIERGQFFQTEVRIGLKIKP